MTNYKKVLFLLFLCTVLAPTWTYFDGAYDSFIFSKSCQRVSDAMTGAGAVVIFTGSTGRVKMGLELAYELGIDEVFISGVYWPYDASLTIREMRQAPPLGRAIVTMGYAKNTRENGMETAKWLALKKHDKVVLVTDDYHMPRALMQMDRFAKNVSVIPYSICSDGSTHFMERIKYVVASWVSYL